MRKYMYAFKWTQHVWWLIYRRSPAIAPTAEARLINHCGVIVPTTRIAYMVAVEEQEVSRNLTRIDKILARKRRSRKLSGKPEAIVHI